MCKNPILDLISVFMRFESELTAFKSCIHSIPLKICRAIVPELIQQGFKQAGVATIRKRRLPLETVLCQSLEWLLSTKVGLV